MLRRAQSNRPVLHPTHRATWDLIINGPHKLTTPQFNHVITGINQLMIGTHDKVTVPGWKAQSNWAGLPWEILYFTAGRDTRLAAYMLGLMAQYAFSHHPAVWYSDQTSICRPYLSKHLLLSAMERATWPSISRNTSSRQPSAVTSIDTQNLHRRRNNF